MWWGWEGRLLHNSLYSQLFKPAWRTFNDRRRGNRCFSTSANLVPGVLHDTELVGRIPVVTTQVISPKIKRRYGLAVRIPGWPGFNSREQNHAGVGRSTRGRVWSSHIPGECASYTPLGQRQTESDSDSGVTPNTASLVAGPAFQTICWTFHSFPASFFNLILLLILFKYKSSFFKF